MSSFSPVSTISFPCNEAYQDDDCSRLSMSSFRKDNGGKLSARYYSQDKIRHQKNDQKQSNDIKVQAQAALDKLDALSIKLNNAIVSNEKLKAEHAALAKEMSLPTQGHSRRRQSSREAKILSNTFLGTRRKSLQVYLKESRRQSSLDEDTFCSGATSNTSLETSDRTDVIDQEKSPIDYSRSTRRSNLKYFHSSPITDECIYPLNRNSSIRQPRRLSLFD